MEIIENLKKKIEENVELNTNQVLSISAVNSILKKPFDRDGIATKTFNNHFNNPKSEYYHMTVEQIINKWETKAATSRQYGSMLDEYIGYNLNNDQDGLEMFNLDYDRDGDERLNNICNSFDTFVNDYLKSHPELVFVTREQMIYYQIPGTDQYIRGRFDALFYNTNTNRFLIVDWKTSNEIEHKPGPWTGKLLGPAKDLLDMDWYTYSIQVYFYKTALENGYLPEGVGVDCVIVQLPGHIIQESNTNFMVHNPAFEYNKDLLDRIFVFAHKKNILMNKKNG